MNYHKISHDDQLNGDGLRVVLFVSGCSHHCKGCQNPQTWDSESGKKFDEKALNEIFYYLDKDYISGITFSGGDPLMESNRETILSLCKLLKTNYHNKNIWIYTGYTYKEIKKDPICKKILKYIDVLVDGEFDKDLSDTNYHWAGSTNQQVIDIQKTLLNKKIILYK